MTKKRKELSQAELWDDSALIRSWDDALEEYKLYHSIHARGERIEDVLKSAEKEEHPTNGVERNGAQYKAVSPGVMSDDLEDGELGEDDKMGDPRPVLGCKTLHETDLQASSTVQQRHPQQSTNARNIPQNDVASIPLNGPAIPPVIFGGVQDEAIKNLMMSWYYAGYYTGLYESQQKTQNFASGEYSQQHKSSAG